MNASVTEGYFPLKICLETLSNSGISISSDKHKFTLPFVKIFKAFIPN